MPGFLDDYEPVENRIRAFWADHPDGRIVTEMVHSKDGDYIFKAFVFKIQAVTDPMGAQRPDATGYAHDSYDQLPPNMKASALEVCETSAIGRALANLGYAPKGRRPSREEMTSATAHVAEPSAPPARSHTEVAAEQGTTTAQAVAEGESSGGGAGVLGEGSTVPPSDALAQLLEAVGGSETKAINAINKAVGGGYRKADLENLTPDEWAAGLATVVMS